MSAVGDALAQLGNLARFCGLVVLASLRLDRAQFTQQAWLMGSGSVLMTLAVCTFAGAMLTVQGFASLKAFGTPELLGMFVALSGVREVFPLVGAGCLGAKLGSAMAAEVATLRVGQQLDALSMMGVDPLRHVVAPRWLAAALVTPLLTGLGVMAGLLSSYLIATLQLGVDPGAFVARAAENLSARDLGAGLVKALAFGVITGALACWHGMAPASGPQGVGRAANLTVVQSMVAGAVVNLILSHLIYGGLT